MAKPTLFAIQSLREAANMIEESAAYQWGHMGACNCGFLAQVITHRGPKEIHGLAMMGHGDWSEQLNDRCISTGMGIDQVVDELLAAGFNREDLSHLERLSDPAVLTRFPHAGSRLVFNQKADVVAYLRAWASLLEEKLVASLPYSSQVRMHAPPQRQTIEDAVF